MAPADTTPPGVVLPAAHPSIVTPEAVVLELEVSNLGWRILAYLLDWLLLLVVIAVLVGVPAAVLSTQSVDPTPWILAIAGVASLLPLAYFITSETVLRGRTLGKMATGLRVVTREGGQIRFRHALVRALLGLVDFGASWLVSAPGLVAVIAIASSSSRQRLGDMAAGTLVVRERRGPPPAPVSFRPPAGLEGYVATLDSSWVSDAEYHVVRAHLLRGAHPPERTVELAAWLCNRVWPPPPHGTPPDVFLVAVAAARQRAAQAGRGQAPAPSQAPWAATGWSPTGPATPAVPAPTPAPLASDGPADGRGQGFAPPA
jgi:uncharacterized RDD family membrane protein YckC